MSQWIVQILILFVGLTSSNFRLSSTLPISNLGSKNKWFGVKASSKQVVWSQSLIETSGLESKPHRNKWFGVKASSWFGVKASSKQVVWSQSLIEIVFINCTKRAIVQNSLNFLDSSLQFNVMNNRLRNPFFKDTFSH